MKIKVNFDILKIIVSFILFILALFFKDNNVLYFILLLTSYFIVSFKVFIEAFQKVLKGNFFDESNLMIIATISAFIIGEYPEAVMVMLLFEFGEYLSDLAVENSKRSIVKLMDLRSDYVNLKKGDTFKKTDINEAKAGDIFIVKPGEKFPLDGVIIQGKTEADTSSLTGESVPRKLVVGSEVLSGFVNGSGLVTVRAVSEASSSMASKIINLLESADEKKTVTEKFITRFSKIYTPIILVLAVLIVLFGYLFEVKDYFYNALVFLVTACPCALVISVPLSFFCGVGRASKEGILIKGSNVFDSLTRLKTVIFDKTGTLTEGKFLVREIFSNKVSSLELLKLVAYGEYYSNHPLAKSILAFYDKEIDETKIKNFKEISGEGVLVTVDSKKLAIGNEKLMEREGVLFTSTTVFGKIVYVACDGEYLGYLVVGDKIKNSAYNLIHELRKVNVDKVVMLSGDSEDICQKVASKLDITEYYSELLPTDKVQKLKDIKKNSIVAFAGDGVNDALVLKEASIGISMGGVGSDAAIEASDIVIMHDDLEKIVTSIKIAHLTQKIVKFNIAFALIFKFLMLILAVFGLAKIWMAVVADVGVTLFAILNALRIMKKKIL